MLIMRNTMLGTRVMSHVTTQDETWVSQESQSVPLFKANITRENQNLIVLQVFIIKNSLIRLGENDYEGECGF